MADSYYETLQIGRGASPEVIRAAYRALMRQSHPDHGGDDGGSAARINEAYQVLSDPARRLDHDRALDLELVSQGNDAGDGRDAPTADAVVDVDWGVEVPLAQAEPGMRATPDAPPAAAVVNPFPWEDGGHDAWPSGSGPIRSPRPRRRPRVVGVAGAVLLVLSGLVIGTAALADGSLAARVGNVAFYLVLLLVAYRAGRRRARGGLVGAGYVIYLCVLGAGLAILASMAIGTTSVAAWLSLAYAGAWALAYVALVESSCRRRRRQLW